MAKDIKHANHTDQRASSEPPDRPTGPLSIPVSNEARDEVKVNNANVSELKNACDDAVKRVSHVQVFSFFSPANLFDLSNWEQYLARPDLFKQIHVHTDVRLGLGWLSVFVAAGAALYGYKVEFEKSKPVVWFGVIMCVNFFPLLCFKLIDFLSLLG